MKFTFDKKLKDSLGTYLFITGANSRNVQELLGHNSSKMTENYNYVSQKSLQKVRSPFDELKEK